MDREPNAREQFEKYRDDDIKGLTNYAREYGAVKALELAAQKTATLQLVIDRYRTGELRAELRPEPTAGDREAAEKITADICKAIGIANHTQTYYIVRDALAAARGNRAELEAAAREAVAEACEFCRYGKKELPGRRDYCKSEHCQWLKIINALAEKG